MTTSVYVWRSFAGSAGRATGATGSSLSRISRLLGGFGHVATQVGYDYLSWWPGEDDGEDGSPSYSHDEDLQRCGRKPDRVIAIRGLAEDKMIKMWEELTARPFDAFDLNCCTVTARVLVEGFEQSEGGFGEDMGRLWRIVKQPARSTWVMVRHGWREELVHSPGEIEELAGWLRDIQG